MKKTAALLLTGAVSAILICSSCQNEKEIEQQRYYVNGKGLFEQHCQNCHGTDGMGLGELYPPLTDTSFIKLNKSRIACFIKNGLSEKITVKGKVYEGKMPAEPDLTAIEIAELVNYISNSFGNKRGDYDVNNAASDLAKCP